METILSKQEINDLLKAIKEGRISTDIGDDNKESFSKPYSPLNLFHINTLSDELTRIPNLDIIFDNFCQNYSITLTNQLQRTFSVSRTGIESSHFLDFLLENKDAGAIAVLDIPPLKQGALIVLDIQLCFSLIEIMLGASTESDHLQPDRKLTKIELSILHALLQKGCDDLDRAFAPLTELKSSVLKVESNSRMVSITDSDAEIIIGTFHVSVGEMEGEIKIMFPLSTLEPLREDFKDLLSVNKSKQGLWTDLLKEKLSYVSTEIIAQSGTITLSVREILDLEEGDILPLDYNPNAPLQLLIGNRRKFTAIPGTHNGKKAISITGVNTQGATP